MTWNSYQMTAADTRLLMENCTWQNNHICITKLFVVEYSPYWTNGAIKDKMV